MSLCPFEWRSNASNVSAMIGLHLVLFIFLVNMNGAMSHNLTYYAGQNAKLTCNNGTNSEGYKIETVRWGRGTSDSFVGQKYLTGREEYVNNKRYSIDDMSSLIIYDAEVEDSDIYNCLILYRFTQGKTVDMGSVILVVDDTGHKNNVPPMSYEDFDRVENMPLLVKESGSAGFSRTGSSNENPNISQKSIIICLSVVVPSLMLVSIGVVISILLRRRVTQSVKEGGSNQEYDKISDTFL